MTLSKALQAQLKLQQDSYGLDPSQMDDQEKMDWIRWNVLALTDELHEALAETGWKPWAKSQHINRDAFVGELVDSFHFFMNLMIVADCSAEELLDRYFVKRGLNAKRQEQGYNGVDGKCETCKRALDDSAVTCTEFVCCEDSDE
jgi:dimeric dUTPase (all-alpha-NTP-PPase superfamily)